MKKLPTINLESLLRKAVGLEKKYEWLQAAEYYERSIGFLVRGNNFFEAAETNNRLGFCFFKYALQANKTEDLKDRMKQARESYLQAVELFKKTENNKRLLEINHSKSFVAFISAWIETDATKKKSFLAEWWNLERQVLKSYEETDDYLAFGKLSIDLLQGCHDQLIFFAKDWGEFSNLAEQCFSIGEKAISSLSGIGDIYELARAYCWVSWYYGFFVLFGGYDSMRDDFSRKSLEYSKKAVTLSEKTGDAYLTGWSYNSASLATFVFEGDPLAAMQFNEKTRRHGLITKDNILLGVGTGWAGSISNLTYLIQTAENPDRQREILEKSVKWAQDSMNHFKVVGWHPTMCISYSHKANRLAELASLETRIETKRSLLKAVIAEGRDLIEYLKESPSMLDYNVIDGLCRALVEFSKTEIEITNRKQLLEEVVEYQKEGVVMLERILPLYYHIRGRNQMNLALAQLELAKIEQGDQIKLRLLDEAVFSMETSLRFVEKVSREHAAGWKTGLFGRYYYFLGEILNEQFTQTEDQKTLNRAIEALATAVEIFSNTDLTTHAAETYWQIGKLLDLLGKNLEAAHNYDLAAKTYDRASEKIPQLKNFYKDYSLYLQAWSQIEQAKHSHSTEYYDEAKQYYEKAAKLHESTNPWGYLASNYLAWACMEEAEGLSRKESTQQAKEAFQKALRQFANAENSIKQKMGEITSKEEKEQTLNLLEASELRRRYCQTRIQIEEAKLLDRRAKYLESSKNYGEAAQNLLSIVEKVETETERNEMEYLAFLCQAWENMAVAEETTSSESYLDAAKLFEKAKDYCYTRKASLWALGNSSFCKGLAAGIRYKTSMDMKENALAKRYIKDAASSYSEAGLENASEYAKAMLRLFDAYVFMNQAEGEVDPEIKAKHYQMAENLLQMAAGSFAQTKQPEKTAQVQRILKTVREEKKLAISLTEVMQAPTITSSTFSFTAPAPTSETSVGLEQFQHANVQANLIAGLREVKVGESFCLSVEFVNAGKEPALLTRVEDFVPPDFAVVKKPEIYRLEDACLNMKGKHIAPLKLVEAKLVLQPSKKGIFQLKPTVHYLDELGQNKSLQLKAVEIKVEEVVLADRVASGTRELDSLLLGGIPEEYAVVLTGPPSDERELLIRNFLEAGVKDEQTSFYVSTEAAGIENLLKKQGFYLFLCNPKPKVEVPDLPNVSRLRSKTDLTNLNIALLKAYRTVQQSTSKRACINIISDVLVDHGVKTTRKWIAELTTDLVSKGFTVLAVMNPGMHPPDQATGIIDLFDGEISIAQSDDPQECKKSLLIKKLRGQDYIKNPISLTK